MRVGSARNIAAMLTACLIALGVANSGKANIIVNGSFESGIGAPPFPPGYTSVQANSTNITGWTTTGINNIDWINNGYWQASNGTYSLDLSGDAPGGIQQTVATVAGEVYTLSFDSSVNPDDRHTATARRTDIFVLDAVSSAQILERDVLLARESRTFTNMQWITTTYSFVATSASTTVRFVSRIDNIDAGGPTLDNVVLLGPTPGVTAVPAPPAAILAGLGAAGMWVVRRRKAATATPEVA